MPTGTEDASRSLPACVSYQHPVQLGSAGAEDFPFFSTCISCSCLEQSWCHLSGDGFPPSAGSCVGPWVPAGFPSWRCSILQAPPDWLAAVVIGDVVLWTRLCGAVCSWGKSTVLNLTIEDIYTCIYIQIPVEASCYTLFFDSKEASLPPTPFTVGWGK